MITAVSLNPSIDVTLFIRKLEIGGSHRVKRTRTDVSGKAVNTAKALSNLGCDCKLVGFDFAESGDLLKETLAKIPNKLIPVPGAIRTNTKIFEEESQVMTEINQEGVTVPGEAVEDLLKELRADESDVLILSGSLPLGVSKGIYAEIIGSADKITILDAYGESFAKGLEAGPTVIKPNLAELEQAFGVKLETQAAQLNFCKGLINKHSGLKIICLSLGADGAMLVTESEALYAPGMDITVRGVQGAGDAMVAGLALCLQEPAYTNRDLLTSAMAAAAASLIQEGTIMGSKKDYEGMKERVRIISI